MFNWFKREKKEEVLYDHNDSRVILKEDVEKSYYTPVDEYVLKIKKEFFSLNYKDFGSNKPVPRKNYVIGVEGGWGTGKSTFIEKILNMLSESLSDGEEWYSKFNKESNVIRVNAWKFSDGDSLKEFIISQISNKVLDSSYYNFNDYNLFNKYSKSFTDASLLGHIVTAFRFLALSSIGIVAFVLAMSSMIINYTFNVTSLFEIKKYFLDNIEVLALSNISKVGVAVVLSLIALQCLISIYNYLFSLSDNDKIKNDINNLLISKNKRYICVIDDIDRLSNDQIYQIFTTVKEIVDFNNILFILAYDRSHVQKSLEDKYDSSETECFIDKIVDYTIKVQSSVYRYVMDRLDIVYNKKISGFELNLKDRKYKDRSSFKGVFDNELFTIRDVNKFIDDVILELSEDDFFINVDIPCYVAIQAIKSKYYKLYKQRFIYKNYKSIDSMEASKKSLVELDLDYIMNYISKVESEFGLLDPIDGGRENLRSVLVADDLFEEVYLNRHFDLITPLNLLKKISKRISSGKELSELNWHELSGILAFQQGSTSMFYNLNELFSAEELMSLELYLDKNKARLDRKYYSNDEEGSVTLRGLCLYDKKEKFYNIEKPLFNPSIFDLNLFVNSIALMNYEDILKLVNVLNGICISDLDSDCKYRDEFSRDYEFIMSIPPNLRNKLFVLVKDYIKKRFSFEYGVSFISIVHCICMLNELRSQRNGIISTKINLINNLIKSIDIVENENELYVLLSSVCRSMDLISHSKGAANANHYIDLSIYLADDIGASISYGGKDFNDIVKLLIARASKNEKFVNIRKSMMKNYKDTWVRLC